MDGMDWSPEIWNFLQFFFQPNFTKRKTNFPNFRDVAPLQRSDEMSPPSQRQASIDWIEVGCCANRAFTL